LLLFAIIYSFLPDLDVLVFKLDKPYAHLLGHRGLTYSILFALAREFLLRLKVGCKNKILCFLVIFLSTISHGVLDAMTSGGSGVGFFLHLNDERFFFPCREFLVSPIKVKQYFSYKALRLF
jgi:inner membrane protein